ncbi:glycosyltransferase [Microbulbifer elongatus]|uniref:glycosyltransferase n=1 Tax=Microbulbifer elongatus TaxID=86173 RepID=UPI001E60CBD8|nr:glycosyltransferase [Microbulbifer elongatus]
MRIVQLVPSMDGGRLAQETLEFAQELARQGHESLVISAGGTLVSRLTLHNCQHLELPVNRKGLLNRRLHRKLRQQLEVVQPDILLCRDSLCSWHGWKTWSRLPESVRPRLVTALHRWPRGGAFRGGWMNGAVSRGELVLASSREIAQQLSQRFSLPVSAPDSAGAGIQVLYRGVNTRELDHRAPVSGHWQHRLLNSFPQIEGRSWLMLPGDIGPGRGQERFLTLLAQLKNTREDLFGLIVGEPLPGQEKFARGLEKRAEAMGLAEHVLFLGARRDMRELYASARITYDLSDPAFSDGRIVCEALAMGCPAVADAGLGLELLQQCFPQGVPPEAEPGEGDDAAIGRLARTSVSILDATQPIQFTGFSLAETTAQAVRWFDALSPGSATLIPAAD